MSVRVGAGLPAAVVLDGPDVSVVWDNGSHRIVLTGKPSDVVDRLERVLSDVRTKVAEERPYTTCTDRDCTFTSLHDYAYCGR